MSRPRIDRHSPTSTAALASLAILLAWLTASCNSQLFQQSSGPSMPVPPPAPVQPPPPPMNVSAAAQRKAGVATYPGGPLRVIHRPRPDATRPQLRRHSVDGNKNIPPGNVVWKGTLDQNVPGIVQADQICADLWDSSRRDG